MRDRNRIQGRDITRTVTTVWVRSSVVISSAEPESKYHDSSTVRLEETKSIGNNT
jgi:hypothetical protein